MSTITWWNASGGAWTTAANWNAGLGPVPGTGDTAILDATTVGSFTVTVDSDVTLSKITWQTSPDQTAQIDVTSGGLLTVSSFTGISASGVVELENAGAGSELDIKTGGLSGGAQSVVFANNGSGSAIVDWDTAATLSSTKLSLGSFSNNDTLDVLGNIVSGSESYKSDVLSFQVVVNGGTHTDSVLITNPASLSNFTFSSNGTDTTITSNAAPCFLRGTRIATLRGDVAVEDLRIGDMVVTATAGALPVKWIGTRGFITKLVNEHHRAALLPVRIAAGALGEASPARDLHVSPEHMLCLDDVLIPAGKLLNGTSITRAEGFDVVQYFHIELPRHAVLYAEGAPAESFLDTGDRNMFSNVLSYLELGYDLDAPPPPACLPIVTEGKALAAVRAGLAGRAAKLGLATTDDDNLHLRVDGIAIRPELRADDRVRFAVPAGARQVRIVSRSVVPADLDPASGDRRRLGICLSGMSVDDSNIALDLAPDHAGFTAGFHNSEGTHRWTQGDALLPADLTAAMPGGFVLDLKLVRTGLRYAAPPQAEVISLLVRRPVAADAERLSA